MFSFRRHLPALLIVFLSVFSGLSAAQLGMVAGQPHVSVPIGSSNSVNITFINNAFNESISFRVVLPIFQNTTNSTVPIVTATPMEMSIPPRTDKVVMLSVFVPSNKNKVGQTWTGVVQFIVESNTTNPGGAVVQAGLAKILTVTAAPAIFDPIPYIVAVVVILAAVAVVALYFNRKKKSAKIRAEKRQVSVKAIKSGLPAGRSGATRTRRRAAPHGGRQSKAAVRKRNVAKRTATSAKKGAAKPRRPPAKSRSGATGSARVRNKRRR